MAKNMYPDRVKKLQVADLTELQKDLEYEFKDLQFLRTAVTHSSAIAHYADKEHGDRGKYYYYYEQLEFVGDRVLGLVIADMLYDMYPKEPEGFWAKRYTGAVREETLVVVAEKMKLGDYLLLSVGEQSSGGRKKRALLADSMEAVIAAIYLDSGLEQAKIFIKKHWSEILNKYEEPPEDPKTKLQEWVQSKNKNLPEYELIGRSGPDHAPVFEVSVFVEGMEKVSVHGSSKRKAEKMAAEILLSRIEQSENND